MASRTAAKSNAARAVDGYRRSDKGTENLARMVMKAMEFVPQVTLPGRVTGTVARYADGSIGFVDTGSGEAMTVTRPEQVAVAIEALQEAPGIPTESWIRTITHGRPLYLSKSVCGRCGGYRRPVSRDEQNRERLVCEQGCPD